MSRTQTSTRWLEALLWCGVAFVVLVLALGVSQILRSDGVDMRAVWFDPYSTPTQADAPVTEPSGPPGTVSLVTPNFDRTVMVAQPTLYQRFLLLAPDLLTALLLGAVALVFLRVVRTLRAGDPFIPPNARRFAVIGALLIGLAVVVPWAEQLALAQLLSGTPMEGTRITGRDEFRWAGLVGVGVLALAEVFRHGTRLRADTEGLV
ncbi:DUF2975 domain-containing protein [Nonomuraea dietziae]|uniref:DUF2975 domain-containing protein n=1 Tax=Nonomuraea dietziae TaxID=65515 RepID=UPI0033ECFD96